MTLTGTRRNVLVVGVDSATYETVAPVLSRSDFDVDRFPSAASAVELLEVIPFDVILSCHPLPDMEQSEFLDRIRGRKGKSACVRSAVVLLARGGHLDSAEELVGQGANRVLGLDRREGELQAAVAGLLRVAPRISFRILARVEVQVESGRTVVLCQTENVSTTGMLLRTDRQFAIGSELVFEFQLPGVPEPVRGQAEVVRHTRLGRDSVMGVGVKFLGVEGDGHQRLTAFINSSVGAGVA